MTNVGQTSYVTICDIACNDSDRDEKNRWAAGQMDRWAARDMYSYSLVISG